MQSGNLVMRPYQRRIADIIVDGKNVGVFLPPGMGKTAVVLSSIIRLLSARKLTTALIVSPVAPMLFSWPKELETWPEFKHLKYGFLRGPAAKCKKLLAEKAPNIWFTTPENLKNALEAGINADLLVLDESHKFKSANSERFRALKKCLSNFKQKVLLTGTPAPRSYEDLWSQIFILDGGERLGKTITRYRAEYFTSTVHRGGFVTHEIKPGAAEKIRAKIKDTCIFLKSEDYIDLPELTHNDVPVILPPEALKPIRELEKKFLLELERSQVTAPTAAVLSGKLRQMVNGCVYDDNGSAEVIHRAKAEALRDLIESLGGEPCLVAVGYRHDVGLIRKVLGVNAPYFGGQTPEKEKTDIYTRWNRGEIKILLLHPASGGAGLNLQFGGRHIIWYSLPWSLGDYQQTNARLYRSGQKHGVVVHHMVAQKTIDTRVSDVLKSKHASQKSLLDALKRDY